MSEDIFASCYVDEGISSIFIQTLRKKGFNVRTATELQNIGFSDKEQLDFSISLKSLFITKDKRTFLQDSHALAVSHFGIIIIPKSFSRDQSYATALVLIEKYLNRYTKDELKNMILYL